MKLKIFKIIKMLLVLQELHLLYVIDIKITNYQIFFILGTVSEITFTISISETEIMLTKGARKPIKIRLQPDNEIEAIVDYFENDKQFVGLDNKLFKSRYGEKFKYFAISYIHMLKICSNKASKFEIGEEYIKFEFPLNQFLVIISYNSINAYLGQEIITRKCGFDRDFTKSEIFDFIDDTLKKGS